MFISSTIWSVVFPCANFTPTWWLRLLVELQVAMRSPIPARPAKVSGCPPSFTPSRVSSASARVIKVALELSPKPEAVGHAGGNGHHVLEGAAQLTTHHIGVGCRRGMWDP